MTDLFFFFWKHCVSVRVRSLTSVCSRPFGGHVFMRLHSTHHPYGSPSQATFIIHTILSHPELDRHHSFNPTHFCHHIQEVDDNFFKIIVTHFKCPHYKWSLWTEKHKDFRGHVSCVYFGLRFWFKKHKFDQVLSKLKSFTKHNLLYCQCIFSLVYTSQGVQFASFQMSSIYSASV